ncbi:ferredoxin-thioredoxin reductase, variable chain-like [Dendrobium catenatum]|uniref:Ferredoxin-thioredoxin reductase, variable chain n=1 Tax=Dendrobium catenatum TaxID=906689 RepID=A0A2I0W484_9ASPA|nr:ferredoxin-thioredoxin reductase, variable chain-like [Dendrobium catenatum]PKU70469.1 Ferredoxin-thioredoxin reductase, variable chain [Dendrobium catenatum]
MPTAANAPSSSANAASIFRRSRSLCLRTTAAPRSVFTPTAAAAVVKRAISCKATLTTDVSRLSTPEAVESKEVEAAVKIGARIRVKAPVKVFHVAKAPGLDLCGMEGVIRQYVGFYKGKRVSANLPYKIEFLLPVEGNEKPIKFFAHLREDDFEVL